MPKAPPAGPSRNFGRPLKPIHKTVDLLRKNEGEKRKGKGKEREVLGDVMSLVDDIKRLPSMIQVEKFVETRAMEIHAFQTAIKVAAAQGSTRAFQSLPRHLRRRAASHNPRRVPKRLRGRAAAEIDSGDTIAKKHRKIAKMRRKGTLRDHLSRTAQFAQRQKNKTWLSTHIWHSKRYHMANLWGHRLPITPTLKSFRPAYRAARRRATASDTSYHGVVELEGRRAEVLAILSRISSGNFAGSKYEDGSRVAKVTVYHFDTFPTRLIGPAEIIWHPLEQPVAAGSSTGKDHARCRLWIRLHPSIYNQVWDILKLASTHLPQPGGSSLSSSLQIRDLRGEVNSLDIIGPRAGKVVRRVLKLCRSELGVKTKFFEGLRDLDDPAQLPEGMVVGLKVHDPRLNFPPSRLTASASLEDIEDILRNDHVEPSAAHAQSTLWDSNVRDGLSKATYTKYQLDARRHRLGLPGTKLRPLSSDDRIPLILYQRTTFNPHHPSEGFYGFTLLLPPGPWAQYLLSSLVYSGVLIGGLQEKVVQHREAGIPCFPEHYGQVCPAGSEWEKGKAAKDKETWDRKPPGKRPEYAALGTKNPFAPDWSALMADSNETSEEVSLDGSTFSPWLLPPLFTPYIKSDLTPSRLHLILDTYRAQRGSPPLKLDQAGIQRLFDTAVVHVELEVLGRGSPSDMTMIYSLSSGDREKWVGAYEEGDSVGAGEVSELHQLGETLPPETDIIGYASTGNFSLSRGRGYALATVTLKGWLGILAASATLSRGEVGGEGAARWAGRALVRVRNRDGRVCRLGEIKVI